MGLLAVSVDLDEVDAYAAVHGINRPKKSSAHPIYERALPRVASFFDDLGIHITLFVVGKDLIANTHASTVLGQLRDRGHEIGNHTMNHPYDLCSLGRADQIKEIEDARDSIREALGVTPVGFRAPGYNLNTQITDLLTSRGYTYDSSVFPCPLYYSAKAVSMGLKALKGLGSAAQIGDPRILGAPTSPYRIGAGGVWSKGSGLTELPITVLSKARLPFIGTSLSLMGTFSSRMLARLAGKLPFVNLELHGIDFADMEGDGLSYLGEHQVDLRIPFIKRRETLKATIDTLLNSGLEPVTLANAATRVFA